MSETRLGTQPLEVAIPKSFGLEAATQTKMICAASGFPSTCMDATGG
jgi:hypothetical protein